MEYKKSRIYQVIPFQSPEKRLCYVNRLVFELITDVFEFTTDTPVAAIKTDFNPYHNTDFPIKGSLAKDMKSPFLLPKKSQRPAYYLAAGGAKSAQMLFIRL